MVWLPSQNPHLPPTVSDVFLGEDGRGGGDVTGQA
jgi:hypothetical protein